MTNYLGVLYISENEEFMSERDELLSVGTSESDPAGSLSIRGCLRENLGLKRNICEFLQWNDPEALNLKAFDEGYQEEMKAKEKALWKTIYLDAIVKMSYMAVLNHTKSWKLKTIKYRCIYNHQVLIQFIIVHRYLDQFIARI